MCIVINEIVSRSGRYFQTNGLLCGGNFKIFGKFKVKLFYYFLLIDTRREVCFRNKTINCKGHYIYQTSIKYSKVYIVHGKQIREDIKI